jgi:PTS system nitrogen regulatory IIA component
MRLVDIASEDLIVPALAGRSRDEVLAEIVARVVAVAPRIDAAHATGVLIARERLGSTGIGGGLAIPHAKVPRLERGLACFARSAPGVDFGALDGQPTHLFLAILAPEGNAGFHLKALARASRLLKDPAFRARLIEAPGAELWGLFRDRDLALDQEGA